MMPVRGKTNRKSSPVIIFRGVRCAVIAGFVVCFLLLSTPCLLFADDVTVNTETVGDQSVDVSGMSGIEFSLQIDNSVLKTEYYGIKEIEVNLSGQFDQLKERQDTDTLLAVRFVSDGRFGSDGQPTTDWIWLMTVGNLYENPVFISDQLSFFCRVRVDANTSGHAFDTGDYSVLGFRHWQDSLDFDQQAEVLAEFNIRSAASQNTIGIPYGQVCFRDEFASLAGVSLSDNDQFTYHGLVINHQAGRDFFMVKEAGMIDFSNVGYRIGGSGGPTTLDLSAVLGLQPVPETSHGQIVSALNSLNDLNLWHSSKTITGFEILLKSSYSNGTNSLPIRIRIDPVQITLKDVCSAPFAYACNISSHLDQSFIRSQTIVYSNGVDITNSWTLYNPVISESLFSPEYSHLLEPINNSGRNYPEVDDGFELGWFAAGALDSLDATVDRNTTAIGNRNFTYSNLLGSTHQNSVILTGESMHCSFFLFDGSSRFTRLVRNNDSGQSESAYDQTNGIIWVNTPEIRLFSANNQWEYLLTSTLSWPDADGDMLDISSPLQPTELSGVVVRDKNPSQTGSFFLTDIQSDRVIPVLTEVRIDSPRLVMSGATVISENTVSVMLTIDDLQPAALLDGQRSGLREVALRYYGSGMVSCQDGQSLPLGITLDGLSQISLSFDLTDVCYRYEMNDFVLEVSDYAQNTAVYRLGDLAATAVTVDTVVVDASGSSVQIRSDLPAGTWYGNKPQIFEVMVSCCHLPELLQNDGDRPVAFYSNDTGTTTPIPISALSQNITGEWLASFILADEASYLIWVDFTDLLGRRQTTIDAPISFVLDQTAPSIQVVFEPVSSDTPGYYNTTRRAEIRIDDELFDPDLVWIDVSIEDAFGNHSSAPAPRDWTTAATSPKSHIIWLTFENEYIYTLTVSATDLAGNRAVTWREQSFTIDLTPPLFTIENVRDSMAYAGLVNPEVTCFDLNWDSSKAVVEITRASGQTPDLYFSESETDNHTKTVSYRDFPHEVSYDDVYRMRVYAIDLAGNETESILFFSVNRFGSTYWFDQDTQNINGSYINKPLNMVVHEVNVSGVDESSIGIRLFVDHRSRVLLRGSDYTLVSEIDGSSQWHLYTYLIDSGVFQDDGLYALVVSSVDKTGSYSESIMPDKNSERNAPSILSFYYDTTAPQVTFMNLESGATYPTDIHSFSVYFLDNIIWASADLVINGVNVKHWDNDADRLTSILFQHYLYQSSQTQTVMLSVIDRAGNSTVVAVTDITVSLDLTVLPISQWWEASSGLRFLAITSAAVLVLVILFGSAYVIHRRQLVDEESQVVFQQKNPDTDHDQEKRAGDR
jgi:hypothetical protein